MGQASVVIRVSWLRFLAVPATVGVGLTVWWVIDEQVEREFVEQGPPAQINAVQAAVPELLGSACMLGVVPTTDAMGGIELQQAIEETRLRVRAIAPDLYASTVVAGRIGALEATVGDPASVMMSGRTACSFEVELWRDLRVEGSEASVELVGGYVQELSGSVVHGTPGDVVRDEPEPYQVDLRLEGGRWLLVDYFPLDPRPQG